VRGLLLPLALELVTCGAGLVQLLHILDLTPDELFHLVDDFLTSLLRRALPFVPAAEDVARLQERMNYADTIAQLIERQNAQEIMVSKILVRGGRGGGVDYCLRRLPCCPMEWRVGCNPVAALPSVGFVCRARSRGISCHVFCHAWPHAGESEEADNRGDALPEGV
jgi:hypothetical protein